MERVKAIIPLPLILTAVDYGKGLSDMIAALNEPDEETVASLPPPSASPASIMRLKVPSLPSFTSLYPSTLTQCL